MTSCFQFPLSAIIIGHLLSIWRLVHRLSHTQQERVGQEQSYFFEFAILRGPVWRLDQDGELDLDDNSSRPTSSLVFAYGLDRELYVVSDSLLKGSMLWIGRMERTSSRCYVLLLLDELSSASTRDGTG